MDVRIERTKRAMQEALLDLARSRPFSEITIGAITDRAQVNRSSFYQHYADKETLLADALDASGTTQGVSVPEIPSPLPTRPPTELIAFLAHIEANAELYRLALCEGGSSVATSRMKERIERAVALGIDASGTDAYNGFPQDVVCAGIAGSALAVIERWLVREPRPSAEVAAEWVWRVLIGPGMHV